MNKELTILVPVFNELANLEQNLPVMIERARRCTERFEIVVIDDGSTDDSPAVVRRFAAQGQPVRLVSHPINLGPGAGIPTGLFWARGDWVMFLPADLACSPEDVERLWSSRTDADLVVGLRSDRRDYGLWRKALSLTYIQLIQRLSGSGIRQFNYIQLYRRRSFEHFFVRSRGVFVTAEIILRAEGAGLRIVELPMSYQVRSHGRAAGASPRALVRCALELVRYFGDPS